MSALRSRPRLVVVVADDDTDMRAYIGQALRRQADVHEASNGDEALRLVHALAPDLVIADVHMPGLDGYALGRALKADATTAAIPFLLVSGETQAPPVDCADGFLAKPFNAAGLRSHVEILLASAP